MSETLQPEFRFGHGKISGVLAVTLGALGFGAVLCLRYPDWLTTPDRARRLIVRCPKGRVPLGGGMTSTPSVGADGEGIYPHSYERLGTQRGFHISALVIDPSPGQTTPRLATIQLRNDARGRRARIRSGAESRGSREAHPRTG